MKCKHPWEFIAESRITGRDVEWCPQCGALKYKRVWLPKKSGKAQPQLKLEKS